MNHNLSFTYKPKIQGVMEGTIRQTIRITRRFKVGDNLNLFTWEGKPYRSPWSWRTLETVKNAIPVIIHPIGIEFPPSPLTLNHYIVPWYELDYLAILDGIDPPTGIELGRVLNKMHKIPSGGVEAQIIRW